MRGLNEAGTQSKVAGTFDRFLSVLCCKLEAVVMSKVEQIEQQIEELSPSEFAELRDWILEQDWAAWDAQIEQDAEAGKLDTLLREAEEDYRSGRSREL